MATETKKFTKKDVEWLTVTIEDLRNWNCNKLADEFCNYLKEAESNDDE